MEMHQVRYFLAVADTLNFTRAAERCSVSQPALTRAIQQLEAELGGLLLRRERKLTHLTDFGRLIQPHLRQLSADAEAAQTTAKRFLSLQQAQIRLGIMCTVGPVRFMSFLASFHANNPGCEITLVEGVPAKLSDMLLQGELDLAVMAQPEPFNDRLDVLHLYDERFCIAFPTGHRLEQQNRVEISDVAGETYLRRINCEYRDYLADQLRALGLAVRVGFQSEREDWIQMMVAALLPPRILADHPRGAHPAGHRSGSHPRGLAGFDVGATLLSGSHDLYPGNPISRLGAERRRGSRVNDQTCLEQNRQICRPVERRPEGSTATAVVARDRVRSSFAWAPQLDVNVSSSVRHGMLRRCFRHPGEGRDPFPPRAPAFAGVTREDHSRHQKALVGRRRCLAGHAP